MNLFIEKSQSLLKKKDFKERVKVVPKIAEKEIELTLEEKNKIELAKQQIRERMKI